MSSSPHSKVTAYQWGLTWVLRMNVLVILVPMNLVSRCALTSTVLTMPKGERGESGTFRSLRKLSATWMLFLGTFSCLNHQLFPPPLLLLCWAMTHLDTRHTTNNYQDPCFISDHFLPPLPASPVCNDSPHFLGIAGHSKIRKGSLKFITFLWWDPDTGQD